MVFGKACAVFLVLGVVASGYNAEAAVPGDLLKEATAILGGAVKDVEGGLKSMFTDLFGPANTFLTQIPKDVQNLSWKSLNNLDMKTPVESFVGSISSASLPSDILKAQDDVTSFIDKFCDPAKCTPSKKVPSNCVGKELTVRLAPWVCSLYKNGTLGCSPPFIEILTAPAVCTAKYEKAGTFKGKECKLEKEIGKEITKTIGGQAFSIEISKSILNFPSTIASSLLPGKFDVPNLLSSKPDLNVSTDATKTMG